MDYISRIIEAEVRILENHFPVITLTGPRQSGKTTLAKQLYPELPYFNFENPDLRLIANGDPRAFLTPIQQGAILDEVQHVPELLSYLQQIVDDNRSNSRFILTGSNQFELLGKTVQSLAGRTALLKLLPLSLEELKGHYNLNTNRLILNGFYPGLYNQNIDPIRFYRNYYETYLERDLRQMVQVKDLSMFQKFIRLCAGRTGNIFNASAIANEVGVATNTIQAWMSVLEASYVVMLLRPYYKNIGKRLIKSPKIYFYDVGLAAYLLGIENENQLSRDPLRGALFENMVIMEMIKYRYNRGSDHQLYYYRDSHHNEIDIVFEKAGDFHAIEIKSAQTFHTDFLKGFRTSPGPSEKLIKTVCYDGEYEGTINDCQLLNFRNISGVL